jgi:hypothetical protein
VRLFDYALRHCESIPLDDRHLDGGGWRPHYPGSASMPLLLQGPFARTAAREVAPLVASALALPPSLAAIIAQYADHAETVPFVAGVPLCVSLGAHAYRFDAVAMPRVRPTARSLLAFLFLCALTCQVALCAAVYV